MADLIARGLAKKNAVQLASTGKQYKRNMTQIESQLFEYPKFEKYGSNPIFTRDNATWLKTAGYKIYFPCVVHMEPILGNQAINKFYMYYSSDHAVGEGGIGLATAPHPTGPWTDYGKIFADTTEGGQTETPWVLWNPDTQLFHMYYHNSGVGRSQGTKVATSTNGVNWTIYPQSTGGIIKVPEYEFPGDGHSGYAHVYRLGKQWVAYHLMGGGSVPHFGMSYSKDGITWQIDPRTITSLGDFTEDSVNRRIEISGVVPFLFRGQLWSTWTTSPYNSSVSNGGRRVYVSPTVNMRKPSGSMYLAVDIGTVGAWDDDTVHWVDVLEFEDKLYMFYTGNGLDDNGAIGIAIAEV